MSSNPFLKRKSRKHSLVLGSPLFSANSKTSLDEVSKDPKRLKNQSLKDPSLMSLNIKEKNPIIFPSAMKKYIKGRKMTLSPNDVSKLKNSGKKEVVSFDDRMNDSTKKTFNDFDVNSNVNFKKGILRWDTLSFSNKNIIFKQELKNIKKILKDKKLTKSIEKHHLSKCGKNDTNSKASTRKNSDEQSNCSDTFRDDVFGNRILKGGRQHRVSFSFKGDMKVVKSWKKFNKKNTYEPNHSHKFDDGEEKKKCTIF